MEQKCTLRAADREQPLLLKSSVRVPRTSATGEGPARMPEANVTEGVSIDDYATWRAVRFADQNEIG